MLRLFNPNSIKLAKETIKVSPSGFRYGFIANLFYEDAFNRLTNTFPKIKGFSLVDKQSGGGRKRFYVGPVYDTNKNQDCACHLVDLPKVWKDTLKESASTELMGLLKDSTGINFNSLCTFGFTYGNEGCVQEPHVDGAVREYDVNPVHSTIACLMYFNKEEGGIGGTCVYDIDQKTILFQAPSLRNGLFFFEQHPDAWHGFPMMPKGAERRLISLAYSQEKNPIDLKTSLAHQIVCVNRYKHFVKKLVGRR